MHIYPLNPVAKRISIQRLKKRAAKEYHLHDYFDFSKGNRCTLDLLLYAFCFYTKRIVLRTILYVKYDSVGKC